MNNLLFILLIIGALLYVVFPRDLLPDFLIGWGWIDDLVVLYLLWRYYRRLKQPQRPAGGARESASQTNQQNRSQTAGPEKQAARDPYATLGVAPGASQAEIKAAYRRLAAKYHPDKVQHLGSEFQKLAEDRFKDIQQAYDELVSR